MEKRWVSLETVIRDKIALPNELEEIARQTKGIFYSWDGFAIQGIEGLLYDEESNYLNGDVTFMCEIVPEKCKIEIHSLDDITNRYGRNTASFERLYNRHFLSFLHSFIPYVELPRVFLPARNVFAIIEMLNQSIRDRGLNIPTAHPTIDQRSETSYKTLLAALLAHVGKYPWGERGGKAAVVKWLARELESLGCAVSEKTIGKHLEGLPDALKKKEIAPISRK